MLTLFFQVFKRHVPENFSFVRMIGPIGNLPIDIGRLF